MPAHRPEDVHALIESAFAAGDLEAFLAIYEQDATLIVPPDGELVHGREGIRRAVGPMLAQPVESEIAVVQKLESDGVALTHARWRTGSISGRGSIVSRRQPDGTWLIVLDNTLTP